MAKYLIKELKKQKHVDDYNQRVKSYAVQRKISNASNAEMIEMIFNGTVRSTESFLKSDNPDFWQELIRRVREVKKLELLSSLKKFLLHVASVSENFFIEKDNLKTMFTIAQLESDFIRMVTIEITNATHELVQIRGKNNRVANSYEQSLIRKWCLDQRLTDRTAQ